MHFTHVEENKTYGFMYVVEINVLSNRVNADQRSVINVASLPTQLHQTNGLVINPFVKFSLLAAMHQSILWIKIQIVYC